MPSRPAPVPELEIHPLTPDRFGDLEQLFGPRGAAAGCWCMFWRLPRAAYRAGKGEANHAALRRYVDDHVPGLLAYAGGKPVGWAAVEPRGAFPRLGFPATDSPVDRAVWSIPCFFVARGHRGQGVTRALIAAAAQHALAHGARVLEAYPSELDGHAPPADIYLGVASTFRALGFEEVARRNPHRPVMRLALGRAAAPRKAPARKARSGSRRMAARRSLR